MFRKEFVDLVNHSNWRDKFIGYGNPDADILIIGQEAADDKESKNYKEFYAPNQSQWKVTIENNCLPQTVYEEPYEFPKFVPSFPFKTQKATIRSDRGNSGATWYWYQRLHDQIYPDAKDPNGNINFFERIFITELNANKYCARFIRDNGSAKYDRYNKSLLFDEKRENLLRDIGEASEFAAFLD